MSGSHEAPQAVLQADGIEIQQQSDLGAAHPQICQKLCIMRRQQTIDGLDLDDEIFGDQEISSEACGQLRATIADWDGRLSPEWDGSLRQFQAEAVS